MNPSAPPAPVETPLEEVDELASRDGRFDRLQFIKDVVEDPS